MATITNFKLYRVRITPAGDGVPEAVQIYVRAWSFEGAGKRAINTWRKGLSRRDLDTAVNVRVDIVLV